MLPQSGAAVSESRFSAGRTSAKRGEGRQAVAFALASASKSGSIVTGVSGPVVDCRIWDETVLERALIQRGLRVERQKSISFAIDGMRFDAAFCVDLLVEEQVVVELKSVEKLSPIHRKQVLTYLRVLDLPIGLLINFGAALMKDGIHRIANGRASAAPLILHSHR